MRPSTVLGAVELLSGETRAAREMYARAAEKLAPWRRHAGWQRLMVAELSHELDDPHRAEREIAMQQHLRPDQGVIAGQRLAALRAPGPDRTSKQL